MSDADHITKAIDDWETSRKKYMRHAMTLIGTKPSFEDQMAMDAMHYAQTRKASLESALTRSNYEQRKV